MDETTLNNAGVPGMRIYPPLAALGCLLGGLLLHYLLPEPRTLMAHHVLGLLLTSGGVGLSFYAAAIFAARETTKDPYGEPNSFVTQMPYTFTRNPMYLGLVTVLLGVAVFIGSPVMLLSPVGFFVLIDRMVIPNEEATMERRFGQQYREYQARVRRWL